MFEYLGIKVTYKAKQTLKHLIGNLREKIDNFELSGIYKIIGNDC